MIFSKDSLWNKPAEMADDKPSAAILNSFGGKPLYLSRSDYSVPIFKASRWSPLQIINIEHPEWGCPAQVRVRFPRESKPATGTDHHLCVLDGSEAHDFWNLRQTGRSKWIAGFYRKWDLTGTGSAPVWTAGCRASGTPLLAGLVVAWEDDALKGKIEHPLALAVPFIQDKTIIPPASATQTGEQGDFLAMGQRIMLDPAFAIPSWVSAPIRVLAETLKVYGAIVVDVSQTPVFYLEDLKHSPNSWWFPNSILSALPLESLRIAK